MNPLELNGGWTQVPPNEDGIYWMACAKPWHSENVYDRDCLVLVEIKDGQRVAVRESASDGWTSPECEAPGNPVWDYESQSEMLAAWRLKRKGESFGNLPPPITSEVFERHPLRCPKCGHIAAIYRIKRGRMSWECPIVCSICGLLGMAGVKYFENLFSKALRQALDDDKQNTP